VPGERVQLVDNGGAIVRLVRALADVMATTSGPSALIGGLAVLARVAGAYRVTNDVDAVAGPDVVDLVLAGRADRVGASWLVDGVKVDLVEVGTMPADRIAPAELPDDEPGRMFVLAHQWALDTATGMDIEACDHLGGTLAVARCRVATPAALVAMKVQSAPRRAAAGRHKAASDYADVHRLLTRPGLLGPIARELAGAPHGLGSWVAGELVGRFVDDAERITGIVRANLTLPPGSTITPADLRATGTRFDAAFRQR
jgi:hypothetical protein